MTDLRYRGRLKEEEMALVPGGYSTKLHMIVANRAAGGALLDFVKPPSVSSLLKLLGLSWLQDASVGKNVRKNISLSV